MIYKKIGDKIPSLSSLLLAGMFLPGGCKQCDGNNKPEDGPKSETVNDAPSKQEEILQPGKGVDNPLLSKAVSKMRESIIKFSNLDYLLNPNLTYTVVDKSWFNMAESTFLSRLKDLLASFMNACGIKYPVSLKLESEKLAKVELEKIEQGKRYAIASAVSKLNEPYIKMSEFVQLLKKLDTKGVSTDEYKVLATDINSLLAQLDKNNKQQYIGNSLFYTVREEDLDKENPWIKDESKKFLSFFTDKKNGKPKGTTKTEGGFGSHAYGIPALLDGDFSIWIKNKEEGLLDQARKNPFDSELASKRGLGIQKWKVKGAHPEDCMPEVHCLENTRVEKKFDISKLKKDSTVDESFALCDLNNDSNEEAVVLSDYSANKLKGSSLLWLLFGGNGGRFDFIQVTKEKDAKGGEPATVSFLLKKKNFYKLLEESGREEQSMDSERFAQALGKYIKETSDLNDLLVIPNYTNLCNEILPGDFTNASEDLKTASDVKIDKNNDKVEVQKGTPLYIVCSSIYRLLNIPKPDSDAEIFDNLGLVAQLSSQPGILDKSDATLNHRVAIHLAAKLFNLKNDWISGKSSEWSSKKSLEEFVKNEIKSVINKAIVWEEVGEKYVSTQASKDLQKVIIKFYKALCTKRSNKIVSYKDIKADLKDFNIDLFFLSTKKEVLKFSKTADLDLSQLLLKPEDIKRGDLGKIDWLSDSEYEELNNQKKQYQAEIAALAPVATKPTAPAQEPVAKKKLVEEPVED